MPDIVTSMVDIHMAVKTLSTEELKKVRLKTKLAQDYAVKSKRLALHESVIKSLHALRKR